MKHSTELTAAGLHQLAEVLGFQVAVTTAGCFLHAPLDPSPHDSRSAEERIPAIGPDTSRFDAFLIGYAFARGLSVDEALGGRGT